MAVAETPYIQSGLQFQETRDDIAYSVETAIRTATGISVRVEVVPVDHDDKKKGYKFRFIQL